MDLVGNYYILLRGRLRAVYDLENQEMAVDGPPSIFYLIKSKLILCFLLFYLQVTRILEL